MHKQKTSSHSLPIQGLKGNTEYKIHQLVMAVPDVKELFSIHRYIENLKLIMTHRINKKTNQQITKKNFFKKDRYSCILTVFN